jgi:hypothetical protein
LHVPLAVGLERGRRAVVAVAVDLDDQPPVPPDEVDLDALDAGVGLGARYPMVVAELEEALLLLALGRGRAVSRQHRPEGGGVGFAEVPEIHQAELVGDIDHVLEGSPVQAAIGR